MEVCTSIKNRGICVYTIVFERNSTDVDDPMQAYVTIPAMLYIADQTDLGTVFQPIGKPLGDLRLPG